MLLSLLPTMLWADSEWNNTINKQSEKDLVKQDGSMDFELTGTNKKLIFTTHYNQYKESYGIYWNYSV